MARDVCPIQIFCFRSCMLSCTKYSSDVTQQYFHLEAFQINLWALLWEITCELGLESLSSTPVLSPGSRAWCGQLTVYVTLY